MGIRSFLVSITAALFILLVPGIWFYSSNDDFRVENTSWNGLKDFTTANHVQPLDSLAGLPPSPYGATLIVIPYLDFQKAELEELQRFVNRGGSLILADDYGYGNRILEYLGLKARFTGDVLLDPLINYKNQNFPRINRLLSDPLTANTDNLVLNHATSLSDIADSEALALSSPFSFLDSNDDSIREDSEPNGPMPVISRHHLGEGEVVLIADPSIFINSMDSIEGNAALIRNIVASNEALYIDLSHLEQSELHRTRNWLEQARHVVSTAAGTTGLVIIAVIASMTPIWRKKKENEDDANAAKKTADIEKHY